MLHAFNPSTQRQRQGISEFKASLVYRVSSRTARATQKTRFKNTKTNKKTTTISTTMLYLVFNALLMIKSRKSAQSWF